MTKGSPLKLMLQFALPLLMGNLLQQTYNIIDAAIVGQILGADALASVGSSSSVQFLVLGFCIGCCAGFGVPVARYFGAGDHRTMRNYIFNGAVLTAIIAAILMIACSLSCGQILHLLSVPDDIFGNAYVYLIVIFIGIPFTLLYNYLSSILRSVGDSRTPFLFLYRILLHDHVFFLQAKKLHLPSYIKETENSTDRLCCDRCDRSSHTAPFQNNNTEQIQENIQDC